jgi:hypothetical protein
MMNGKEKEGIKGKKEGFMESEGGREREKEGKLLHTMLY